MCIGDGPTLPHIIMIVSCVTLVGKVCLGYAHRDKQPKMLYRERIGAIDNAVFYKMYVFMLVMMGGDGYFGGILIVEYSNTRFTNYLVRCDVHITNPNLGGKM